MRPIRLKNQRIALLCSMLHWGSCPKVFLPSCIAHLDGDIRTEVSFRVGLLPSRIALLMYRTTEVHLPIICLLDCLRMGRLSFSVTFEIAFSGASPAVCPERNTVLNSNSNNMLISFKPRLLTSTMNVDYATWQA